jgi:hypothetical protein
MRDFEVFDPRIGSVSVSVAHYGLTFSRAAVEVMGKPKYIILGFDKSDSVIVIKPAEESDPRKIAFIEKEKNGNVRINSKEFVRMLMRYFPNDDRFSGKASRYLSYWDDEEGALLVDLKRPLDSDEEE